MKLVWTFIALKSGMADLGNNHCQCIFCNDSTRFWLSIMYAKTSAIVARALQHNFGFGC